MAWSKHLSTQTWPQCRLSPELLYVFFLFLFLENSVFLLAYRHLLHLWKYKETLVRKMLTGGAWMLSVAFSGDGNQFCLPQCWSKGERKHQGDTVAGASPISSGSPRLCPAWGGQLQPRRGQGHPTTGSGEACWALHGSQWVILIQGLQFLGWGDCQEWMFCWKMEPRKDHYLNIRDSGFSCKLYLSWMCFLGLSPSSLSLVSQNHLVAL